MQAKQIPENSIVKMRDGKIGRLVKNGKAKPQIILDSGNKIGRRVEWTEELEVVLTAADLARNWIRRRELQQVILDSLKTVTDASSRLDGALADDGNGDCPLTIVAEMVCGIETAIKYCDNAQNKNFIREGNF